MIGRIGMWIVCKEIKNSVYIFEYYDYKGKEND